MSAITFESLLNECNLVENDLNLVIEREYFPEISRSLTKWKVLALKLPILSEGVMADITANESHEEDKRLDFLKKLKQKLSYNATYGLLVRNLLKIERAEDARSLCCHLKSLKSFQFEKLKREDKTLKEKFENVVKIVQESFAENEVKCTNIFRSLQFIEHHEEKQMVKQQFKELKQDQSLDNLFFTFSDIWNYIHPGLLEFIVEKFGTASDKNIVQEYKEDLKKYRRSVKLGEFVQIIRKRPGPPLFNKELSMHVGEDWRDKTLQDLEDVRLQVADEAKCEHFLLRALPRQSHFTIVLRMPSWISLNLVDLHPAFSNIGATKVYLNNDCIYELKMSGHKHHPTEAKDMDTKTKAMDTKTKAMDTKTKAMDTKTKAMDTKTKAMDTKTKAMDTKTKSYGHQNQSYGYQSQSSHGHQNQNYGHHSRREPSGIQYEKQKKHSSHFSRSGCQKFHARNKLSKEDVSTLARSNPNRVLEIVNKNESSFLAAYDYKMFIDCDDVMNQLVKILYLLAISDDFERIASRTVARIFNSDAKYAYFLCRLERNIKSMGKERSQHALNSIFEKIRHLIDIGLKMICYLPESSLSLFPYLHLKEAVRDLDKKAKVSDDILQNMEKLSECYDEASSRRLSRQVAFGKFKNSSILPSCEELISGNHRKTLQANIIKGSYRDWNHYLETQYHLMRQDFLIPLRMGINRLLARDNLEKREETIYVYSNVKIEEPVFLYSGVGFHLRFDPSKHRNIDWDQSKRLIFGSLLCLSKDNFQSSVLFASVTKRDSCLLKDGFVTVKFEEDVCALQLRVGDTFTMVESMAYFEAYRHILVKLQEMSLSVETLPFQRYIVSSLLHEIPPPSYHSSSKLEFDMSQVLGCSSQVVLSDPTSWPFPSATCLNESQMRALQQALCKEISVIQGPPGTGKTYIGLKAVEAFLVNRSKWDHQKEAPIVVICYTNHALDQFLEGIQQIKVAGKQPKIVRIGGRCKSVKLSEAILKNKVDEYRETRELSRKVLHGLNTAHINMTEIKKEMNAILLNKLKCRMATLSTLKGVMLERHYRSLQRMLGQEDTKIQRWLDGVSFHHSSYDRKAENFAGDREDITDVIEANTLEQIRATEGEEIDFVDFTHPREATVFKDNEAKRQKLDKHAISYKPMTLEEVYKIDDIFSLSRHKKQELYSYWMNKIHGDLTASKKNMDDYEAWCKKYMENRHEIEKEVLFEIDVVGMTTTGAAKHHHILKNIHPKIVIFEEAAEIFESHIITSLPISVQQLILIGDHQQLKPKPNTYDLEVNFNLGVSLFERLVLNGIEYTTLEVQHRMRPEISSLIHPSIYHNMLDHESVTQLEPVRGIAESVFMITHSCHENYADKMESTTHTNEFEADYLVSLCDYLLKQGYKPNTITILAMYRGQLFEFKRKMNGRERFRGVTVAVVDDFQGEENDIILLSLVRSNSDKNIGFVGDSNRICVSLSRAKLGLYIIGNKEMFCDQDKTKWPQIIKVLEDRKCIHHSLPLFCRVHPDSKVWAKVPEDFLKSPEGGCDRKCGTQLACGHACPKMCHPKDMNHENYKCLEPCTKVLPCNHKCKNICWKCKNGCPPCKENVEKVIPKCGHTGFMYCSAAPNKFVCVKTCTKPLKNCGHPCSKKCYEKCTTNCVVLTEKKLLCGHTVRGKCSEDIKCSEPCRGILDCGDTCTGTCSECHMGRMHKQCQKECGRQLFCGHICSSLCASDCPPCVKSCTNFCVHSRCPKKCYEPCTPCMEPCQWECKHLKCTKLCGEICNRPPCDKPCEKHLKKCGHPCIGICGEECPNLCRICDKEEVCEIFFGIEDEEDARFIQLKDCSHLLEVTGLDRFVNDSDIESGGLVKFSECPKCRTPIRTSLRYCNKVKEVLSDIEELKKKQLVLPDGLIEKVESLHKYVGNQHQFLQDELHSLSNKAKNYKSLLVNTMFVQASIFGTVLQILKMFSCLPEKIKNLKNRFPVCDLSRLKKDLTAVKCFVSQEYLTKHQIADVTCETRRILCAAKLCDLLCKISELVLSEDHQTDITKFATMLHEGGWNRNRISADEEDQFVSLIGEIEESHGLTLSEKERIEIVKAIGLKKGHWYKCENGHYYCIGECGGAMERGKCPECGIVIGGERHTLADGNLHAGEMDNSRHSAWSHLANLKNYELLID